MEYVVKAYRLPEGVVLLRLAGESPDQVKHQAEGQGYRVISAEAERRSLERGFLGSIRIGKRFSVADFSHDLLVLLEAGLSLMESLEVLARKAKGSESSGVFSKLHGSLKEGQALSRVLESMPATFPPLYVATIRTSERTGDLAQALRRYLEYHRQINLVRDKIVSASVYPILLLSVGTLVVFFLLAYVIPRFSHIYEDMGSDLPLLSRVLMEWGRLFGEHAIFISLAFFASIALVGYALSRVAVRSFLEQKLWTVPALGEKFRLFQLARLSHTLAMLLNGGIPVVPALDMVGGLLREPALRFGLQEAVREVREGQSVSQAFERHGLATEVGVRLLAVGERSGDMAKIMDRIASVYDDEVSRWIDWFAKLFEPILMIFIGLLIGGIVLLMYMPIFELANSIQ